MKTIRAGVTYPGFPAEKTGAAVKEGLVASFQTEVRNASNAGYQTGFEPPAFIKHSAKMCNRPLLA